jgi:signal transduction histidine kinase
MSRSMNGPAQSPQDDFTPSPGPAAFPADDDGGAPDPGPQPSASSRFSPRNWRVTTRLHAILLIPVIVGLVMGGFQVEGSIATWRQAEDAERTARLVQAALTYSQRLVEERDLSTAPLLHGHRKDPVVVESRAATDRAAAAFDAAARQMPHTEGLERRLAAFRKAEPGLAGLRARAYTGKLGGVATEEGYVAVQHPLTEFANELGLGTGNITSYGRTVYAISLTKAAVSLQRSIGTRLLVKPGPGPADLNRQRTALSSYAYLEGISVEEYLSAGTAQDAAAFSRVTERLRADAGRAAREKAAAARARGHRFVPPPSPRTMVSALAALPGTRPADRAALARRGITEDSWWAATTARFDADRKVEADLAARAVHEAAGIADDARRATFVTAAAVLLALLTAFVLAGLMARQMSHSMRRLRTAALRIAQQRLPMIVDQLSRTAPGRVDTRVAPLPVTTTDEIGEVARAFDQVHREAVRLAAEQALLRGNIHTIFANLSRRNESLIEGQLALITDLESHETDPDQLASLFRLDHLATRMRRNGENLLVLSGEQPGRSWDQPVPLVDILRAAFSEVEQYHRIELFGVPDHADIHGLAVTDLVHLLAELLENAIVFSSPKTRVRVSVTRLPDGRVMVEIHDEGVGLMPEDFADVNHRLAHPPAVDAALSQRMGLFVVGRLAGRHGIRVQLRPSEQAGTTALVMLPDAITHGGGGALAQPEPEFTVSSIIPKQLAQPALEMRTAAELGFDDSRYGDHPEPVADLDPVSRSLRRGERLTAGVQDQAQPDQDAAVEPSRTVWPPERAGSTAYAGSTEHVRQPSRTAAAPGARHRAPQPSHGPQGHLQDAQGRLEAAHRASPVPYAPQVPAGGPQPPDVHGAGRGGPAATALPPGRHAFRPDGHPQGHSGGDDAGSRRGEWAQHGSIPAATTNPHDARAESALVTDGNSRNRVGLIRSGPAPWTPQTAPGLTDAGLPRRSPLGDSDTGVPVTSAGPSGQPDSRQDSGGRPHPDRETPTRRPAVAQPGQDTRRSTNDERRERAESLRAPRAGGVTPSGLPMRTPRANLVEGSAEHTPRSGPQVSRAPQDIRGRLSSLRRGVRQGHSEVSTSKGRAASDARSGPTGPDSTYPQER